MADNRREVISAVRLLAAERSRTIEGHAIRVDSIEEVPSRGQDDERRPELVLAYDVDSKQGTRFRCRTWVNDWSGNPEETVTDVARYVCSLMRAEADEKAAGLSG